MKFSKLAAISAMALPLAAAMGSSAGADDKFNLTLSGASPGGLWSRIGGGLDAAIAAAYPGSTVTYQTGSGGFANIALVSRGKVPLGLAVDMELKMSQQGVKPFRGKIDNIRQLVRVYTPAARFQMQHALIRKDVAEKYGLKSVSDIAKKKPKLRVAINRRGNSDSDIGRLVFEQSGVTLDDIKKWGGQVVYAASREITSLMNDRRIDMTIYGIAYRHPRIREVIKGLGDDLAMLQIEPDVAKKVAELTGGEVCVVKAKEYPFIAQDHNSVCVGAVVIVNKSMSDEQAYKLTKAVFEKIEKFKTAHRLIARNTTPESLAQGSVIAHHPGAVKYLKEKGLMK